MFSNLYARRPKTRAIKVGKVTPADDAAQQALNVFAGYDGGKNVEEFVIMTGFLTLNRGRIKDHKITLHDE